MTLTPLSDILSDTGTTPMSIPSQVSWVEVSPGQETMDMAGESGGGSSRRSRRSGHGQCQDGMGWGRVRKEGNSLWVFTIGGLFDTTCLFVFHSTVSTN